MVAMAGDSYLLKVPAPPCQARCQASRCQARCQGGGKQSSCEVAMVVTLVVLAAGMLSLAGIVYYLNMELNKVHTYTIQLEARLHLVDTKVTNLNVIEAMKAFENPRAPLDGDPSDTDEFDEDIDDEDDTDIFYPDEVEGFVESRVRDDHGEASSVEPLQPAGSLVKQIVSAIDTAAPPPAPTGPTDTPDDSVSKAEKIIGQTLDVVREALPDDSVSKAEKIIGQTMDVVREALPEELPEQFPEEATIPLLRMRRDAQAAQPQLKLYHMLQSPVAQPPPAEIWSAYGSRHPQPMYAERAPTGFVTPPRPAAALLGTTPSAPIASRRSRVMDGETAPRGPYHRTGRRQRLQEAQQVQQAPLLQEVPQDVSQDVQRSQESIDSGVEVEQTWRPYAPIVEGPAIAAHFVGDSGRHRGTHHYDENGRLKHPTGEYADWRASDWVQELGLDHHFRLAEAGGHVTVDTPGLYFVYAQVNYANDKDENGYWVYRNGHKELLCAVTSAVAGSTAHANTCFTAGVLHLARGDRVSLRDLAGDRYRVLDHPGRSFIGLVNLSSCKLKQEQPSRVGAA